MSYRRILLIRDLDDQHRDIATIIRRVAPDADLLLVVARLTAPRFAWFSTAAPPDLQSAAANAVNGVEDAMRDLAKSVEVSFVPALSADDLAATVEAAQIDLLLAARLGVADVATVAEVRKRTSVPVLWSEGVRNAAPNETELLCLGVGRRAAASTAAFLRDHADASMHATVVVGRHFPITAARLDIRGIKARVDVIVPPTPPPAEYDLLVMPRFPGALLPVTARRAPVLILPPIEPAAPAVARAIDAADVVDDRGVLRTSIRYTSGVGRIDPIPDQQVAFVSRGEVVATVDTHDGAAELRAPRFGEAAGLYRVAERKEADLLARIEQEVSVIRPGARELVLFDASIDDRDLACIATAAASRDFELLAVRLRPVQSCKSVRLRLAKAGLAPRVVDASSILDEGPALDVSENVDSVRLARAATRMRGAGFPVVAIVYNGARTPTTFDVAALGPHELAAAQLAAASPVSPSRSLVEQLDCVTGTRTTTGNRIEAEMDNGRARRWLLDAIASASRRIHLQLYMALDDDVGKPVEQALADAAARGVKVRVVADSLHGLEGSFGFHNPVLERLKSRPGVELRLLNPITTVPTVEEFKQRDHRKIAVFDGTLALIGGRNLSHEYYSGFDEVPLTTKSLWREVPWLDAGARVEGPAVADLERSFLDAWTASGGVPFEINTPAAAGSVTARVVTHHGLRDACTLEAYLAFVEAAQSHVYAVNGFPLILELQHALLRALRRGVRVRTLFGNLTPTHGGQTFSGPWSSARTEATGLVHSRMDALIAAGAEAFELVIPPQKRWAADVGAVHPHVHAKVMSIDGRVCAVGSANLDVTAGYWENELMLVVDDPTIALGLEAIIDRYMAASQRIHRDDPKWQETAQRRRWMRRWPGVLSI